MRISDFMSVADVMIDVRAADKHRLLLEMSQQVAQSIDLPAEQICAALEKREQLGSTGMGDGVAIPHTRLSILKKPRAAVARLKPPIDFDAIDGRPVDLVVMLLLPTSPEADQLSALALIARTLKSPEILALLRQARSASEFCALIAT